MTLAWRVGLVMDLPRGLKPERPGVPQVGTIPFRAKIPRSTGAVLLYR